MTNPTAMRTLLLNPGPVTLSDRVRAALAGPDLCHREVEYENLAAEVGRRLLSVYPAAAQEGYTAVLLTGSGTAAVEAMVGTLVPPDGKALVAANGVYGERMARMLAAQRKSHRLIAGDWTRPVDTDRIEACLAAEGGFTHLLAVHHETTTGRLNRIEDLAALCRRHGLSLLLDTVSSFGAEEIDFSGWPLEACAATANKCLHGVPGISFVLVRGEALRRPSGATSLYLDLHGYHAGAARGQPPFTPAVQATWALCEALRELEDEGGWRARRDRYRMLAGQVAEGLAGLGIVPLLDDPEALSCVLRAWHLPAGRAYGPLHEGLKAAGFVIYAGQGDLADRMFRISTMGAVTETDVARLVETVAAILRRAA